MKIEKIMTDRKWVEYRDLFNHIEYILNTANMLLNSYGYYLSKSELELFSNLILKLEMGKCEIIEFKEQICKFDTDKIIEENKKLKEELNKLKKEVKNNE